MSYITGTFRHQVLLLPERIEDYVDSNNPVRFLDAFVASLDLRALGFVHADTAPTGRPPYDPAALLRLPPCVLCHRIPSTRLLKRECHRNVKLIWLWGQSRRDLKTIADFRKDTRRALLGVSRQFMRLCQQLDLFGAQL